MTFQDDGHRASADRFDEIEAILQRYPDIDPEELARLRSWFTKEASAFETASLASKDHLAHQYIAFRTEHLDRWEIHELAIVAIIAAVILSSLAIALAGG